MTADSSLNYLVTQAQEASRWAWVNYVGVGTSVVGAIVSVLVFIIATNVKTFFYRNTRVPKLRDEIKLRRSQIGACLKENASNNPEIREHLSVCCSNLKSLKGKVPWKVRRDIAKTFKFIDKTQTEENLSNIQVHTAYRKLLAIETDISNWLGDLGGMGV